MLDHPVNMAWYEEELERCILGYEKDGYRITGDHYWFLNFMKIDISNDKTTKFESGYPSWIQTDDYVFKQIEEARQSDRDVMFFTGRGSGKTYMVSSIGIKNYVIIPGSVNVVSASDSDAATNTFNRKVLVMLNAFEKTHPTWRHKRLEETKDRIVSGAKVTYSGSEKGSIEEVTGYNSSIEKVVYSEIGKTDGMRIDWQMFEEIGSWSKNPSLKDCRNKSRGTWYVGEIKRGMVFYIGTGGSVLSDQAKDMFYTPEAYNLYVVRNYENRPHSLFVPAYDKYAGYYNDPVGAKRSLDKEREKIKEDPNALEKFIQAYPYTAEEVFRKSDNGVFPRGLLANQKSYLKENKTQLILEDKYPVSGNLFWKSDTDGVRIGVTWMPHPNGKIKILEHPDWETGKSVRMQDLYIGGLDSIDQDKETSVNDKGSELALMIKKRYNGLGEGNYYVLTYNERPDRIEDAYENVLKILFYYNARVNLEYSKIAIVPYFKRQKPSQYWRFISRPALMKLNNDKTNLIGTQMTAAVSSYGITKTDQYIKENVDRIMFDEVLDQLIEYSLEEKTKYDMVAAMMLTEIADEDMSNKIPVGSSKKKVEWVDFGYYIDPVTGYRQKGKIGQNENTLNLTKIKPQQTIKWIDVSTNTFHTDDYTGE
jgi:hypothetical protein